MTQSIKKAIITGASGFLGTALCAELSRRGVEVIAVVRESSDTAYIDTLPGLRVVRCDMEDYAQLPDMINDRDIDVFFHLAWRGVTGADKEDPMVQISNIACACDAVAACSSMGCGRFVFASSVKEADVADLLFSDERYPVRNMFYSVAKIAAAAMTKAIAERNAVSFFRVMYVNVYGPSEPATRSKTSNLINNNLSKLKQGEKCTYHSGEQIYDFIHIFDAVGATIAIATYGKAGSCYCVGSGAPRPLDDYMHELVRVLGMDEMVDGSCGDTQSAPLRVDFDALHRDTGFVPAVDFSQGIRETYAWILNDNRSLSSGGGGRLYRYIASRYIELVLPLITSSLSRRVLRP